MTNVESYLTTAVKALEEGKLNSSEEYFIEDIKDYDKKQLKNLSSKQYNWLRQIASKY